MENKENIIKNIKNWVNNKSRYASWDSIPTEYKYFLLNQYNNITDNYKEALALFMLNLTEKPKCPICGNFISFNGNVKYPFNKTCSISCSYKLINNESKQTKLEKYGDENYVNSKKAKQTKLEKYGDENYVNYEKIKQTCMQKYGVSNAGGTEKSLIKIKNTLLQKYGVDSSWKIPGINEKSKQTKLKRYGNENYVNSKKAKQTKLEKYGNENYNNHEKYKITCLEKYGVDHNWKIAEEHNLTHTPEALEKKKQTSLINWGYDYPSQSPIIKKQVKETLRKNNKLIGTSKQELQLYDFIKQYFPNTILHYYGGNEYPFEADFYIPEIKLYIEYQGFQTHGGHPYDKNNKNDIILADNIKKIFKTNIVFTKTDPYKRYLAKTNNLNWIEFWNINEAKKGIIKIFNDMPT